MEFPSQIEIEKLDAKHIEYQMLLPLFGQIEDLACGGYRMDCKRGQYLKKRPGEEEAIYKLRLEKFVYTNILGDCLNEVTNKISSASLNIEGVLGDGVDALEEKFWRRFRNATDGIKRSERDLIGRILLTALKFRTCWVQLDRKGHSPRNRLEEEQSNDLPYLVLLTPFEVINWAETDGKLQWVKYRQITSQPNLFGEPQQVATWTIVTADEVVRYASAVTFGRDGSLNVVGQKGQKRRSVPLVGRVSHGYPVGLPIFRIQLPNERWVANQAYLKALQYLQIENNLTDAANIAGYVQRVFQPLQMQEDATSTFDVEEQADVQSIRSSNATVLVGQGFQFSEVSGSAIRTLRSDVLDPIKQEIKAIVGLGNVTASPEATQQSGVSKGYDYGSFNDSMRYFGEFLVAAYQDLLQAVAVAAGFDPQKISVTGLDTFDMDALGTLLEQTQSLLPLFAMIPASAVKMWLLKVVGQMFRSASPAQLKRFEAEIDAQPLNLPVGQTPVQSTSEPSKE